jgi:hypothetical protein
MIDYVFGCYLMKYNNINIDYKNNTNNNTAIILIATKPSFWLPLVIKNALNKINNCNFYFFGSDETIFFIKNNLKLDINYIKIPNFKNIKDYNKILLNIDFWNNFKEDYILVIQPDCIILRNLNENDYNFDYIGAICGSFDQTNYIINGGLSMRNKKIMIEICKHLNIQEKSGNIPEDIIFTEKIRNNKDYKLPSFKDCMNFSIESFGNIDNVLGIHGTDKYYMDQNIKLNFIKKFLKN